MGMVRGYACAVAFSPDGKTLAVGAERGEHTLRLLDVPTSTELRQFGPAEAKVQAMTFSPDGKTLAAGGNRNPVRLWDPATGAEKARLGEEADRVLSLAFSPDGKTLAAIREFKVCLWDVGTGKELRQFGDESEMLQCLAVAPNGGMLATGSASGTVRLRDMTTGKEVRSLPKLEDAVRCVAFSPDGKSLAAAYQNQTLHLWDVATGRELHAWGGDATWVNSVAFAPDGQTLAYGGLDHLVHFWDVPTGKDLHRLPDPQDRLYSVVLLPDGKTLGTAGYAGVRVWRIDSAEEVRTVPDSFFSSDGRTLVCWGDSGRTVRLLDPLTGRELWQFQAAGSRPTMAALSPDGRTVAVGHGMAGEVWLQRLDTGEVLHRFAGAGIENFVGELSFSSDGKTLLATRFHTGLWLWDVATGREIAHRDGIFVRLFRDPADHVRLAPDGKRLALLRLGEPSWRFDRVAVCAVTGKELRRWPWCEAEMRVHTQGALAFSPDGKIVTGLGGDKGQTARLLFVASGRERRLEGHGDTVWHATFADDSRTLVTVGLDGTIRMWEVATGRERLRLEGHKGRINAVAMAPDGRTLVSCGDDTTALLWDLTGLAVGGRPARLSLTPAELGALWEDLADTDARKAYRALWKLTAAEQGVPLLRERLRPAVLAEAPRLAQLLAELDDSDFAVRERATRQLEELGEQAEAALCKAQADPPSAEVRRRVEQLLERIEGRVPSGEALRGLRAVEALERNGTPEARAVLGDLAGGAPQAQLTQEAKASLERLAKQAGSP
jgi:WD40 repeat protein